MIELNFFKSSADIKGKGYKDLGIFKKDEPKLKELIVSSVLEKDIKLIITMLDGKKQGEGEIYQVFIK